MKKAILVLLVILVASAASAGTVSLVDIVPGDPGSAENPLSPSDSLMVYFTSDDQLLALDALMSITGNGEVIGAVSVADAADYGWDPGLSFDPIISDDSAEVGLGNFGLAGPGIIGYVLIHCTGSGSILVDIVAGHAFGGGADVEPDPGSEPPDFSTATVTIHQIPEPATLLLLGLGGLALLRRL